MTNDPKYNCTIDGQTYPMRAPDAATAAERIVAKLETLRSETEVHVADPRHGTSARYIVHRYENPTYVALPLNRQTKTINERDEYRY